MTLAIVLIYFSISYFVNKEFLLLFAKISNYDSFLKPKRQIYPVIYLYRAFINFLVPFIASHIPYIYESLASLGVIYLTLMAIYRPYCSNFDNFVICMNEFIIICTASWIFMKGLSFYTEDIEYMIEMAMIALLLVVIILSSIRIMFGFKERICRKEDRLKGNRFSFCEREDLDFFSKKKDSTFLA